MNRKVYSIFLCAILTSTFVHDFFGKVAANQNMVSRLLEFIERTTSATLPSNCRNQTICRPAPAKCETVPPLTSPPGGLTIASNVDANLLAVVNRQIKVGIIVDGANNIVGLINGNSSEAVIINLEKMSGVHIKKKDIAIEGTDLIESLQTLSEGLRPYLNIPGVTKFEESSVPTDVIKAVNVIVVGLIPSLKEELKAKPELGIKLSMAISSKLVKLIQGPLKDVLPLLGTSGVNLKDDLAAIVNSLEGLGKMFERIPGGVPALIQKGLKIDLQKYGDKDNGIERLTYLFEVIGTKTNLGKDLRDLLNDPEIALSFLAQLSGNTNDRINGLIKLASKLISFVKKNLPLEVLLNVVIQVIVANKENDGLEFAQNAREAIAVLLKAIAEAKAAKDLTGFVNTLSDLRVDEYILDNVHISSILQFVVGSLTKPHNLLVLVLGVVIFILPAIELTVSLPTLLVLLLINLNNFPGLTLLKGLGLVSCIALNSVEALAGGLLSLLVSSVTSTIDLLLGDLPGALGTLPVIGDLLKALQEALNSAGIEEDLLSWLRSNSNATDLIRALLQELANVELAAPPEASKKVKDMIQSSGTLNQYLGLDLIENIVA